LPSPKGSSYGTNEKPNAAKPPIRKQGKQLRAVGKVRSASSSFAAHVFPITEARRHGVERISIPRRLASKVHREIRKLYYVPKNPLGQRLWFTHPIAGLAPF